MEQGDLKGSGKSRLMAQVDFFLATDALKSVVRNNVIHNGSRAENAAEHSWHLSLLAMTFAEYAPPGVNIAHVSRLLLVHDLVEVYAGDHWEPEADTAKVAQKEAAAAEALFGRLPEDQRAQMLAMWLEFEARQTWDAKFARAIDALHPMLLVWGPNGTGQTHQPLSARLMRDLKRRSLEPFPQLWALAQSMLDAAVADGTLAEH